MMQRGLMHKLLPFHWQARTVFVTHLKSFFSTLLYFAPSSVQEFSSQPKRNQSIKSTIPSRKQPHTLPRTRPLTQQRR